MSKMEPRIQKYMTCQPHAVDVDEKLSEAAKIMSELKIRHLPVMKSGEVAGILSDRDIRAALSLRESHADTLKVADVYHSPAYTVDPDTLLHEVTDHMATHHYGCAIVVQNKKLVGIFTTTDACKVITALLEQRFHV